MDNKIEEQMSEYLRDEIERVRTENDRLRAELMKAPNAQMVAFIADIEIQLQDIENKTKSIAKVTPYQNGYFDAIAHIMELYEIIKSRHGLERI